MVKKNRDWSMDVERLDTVDVMQRCPIRVHITWVDLHVGCVAGTVVSMLLAIWAVV